MGEGASHHTAMREKMFVCQLFHLLDNVALGLD